MNIFKECSFTSAKSNVLKSPFHSGKFFFCQSNFEPTNLLQSVILQSLNLLNMILHLQYNTILWKGISFLNHVNERPMFAIVSFRVCELIIFESILTTIVFRFNSNHRFFHLFFEFSLRKWFCITTPAVLVRNWFWRAKKLRNQRKWTG